MTNKKVTVFNPKIKKWITIEYDSRVIKKVTTKCRCQCHTDKSIKHIQACCQSGYNTKYVLREQFSLNLFIDDLYTIRKSLTLLDKELLKNRAPFNFSDHTNQMDDCQRLIGEINQIINENPQIE